MDCKCLLQATIPYVKDFDSPVENWKRGEDGSAAVLMVVHAKETNMYDQQWLSLKLYQSYPY